MIGQMADFVQNNHLDMMNLFEQHNMGRVSAATYGKCLLASGDNSFIYVA